MPRVLVTEHLANLYRDPRLTEVVKGDWLRVRKFLGGEWPQSLPRVVEWRTDTVEFYDALVQLRNAPYLVIDTEYVPESGYMWCLGIGAPGCPVVQWWPRHEEKASYGNVARDLRELIQEKPVVFQNALADLPILEKNLGIKYHHFKRVEDTMFLHSVLWCELPHDLEFAASVYGAHEKLKHLEKTDPRYNAGDVAETMHFWEGLRREASRDKASWHIYSAYMLPLIPIILEAQARGIRVDHDRVRNAESVFRNRLGLSTRIAQAYAGYPLNLGSNAQLCAYLTYELGKKVKSIDADSVSALRGAILPFDPQEEPSLENALRRIEEGGHPILELRVVYARAQQYLSHYINPMLESPDGRIYPEFHPWAQNTGRWSSVNPPTAQLPNELRVALLPDEGWAWVEFDWDQIELRLLAAQAEDKPLLDLFASGHDPHTLNMCDLFGYEYPPLRSKSEIKSAPENEAWRQEHNWQVNDDPRRTFAKTDIYRLCYGGREDDESIPGAKGLGLDGKKLAAANRRWMAKHPAIKRFWRRITQSALRTRQLRTFLGRRWNFLSHNLQRIKRQMYDFPMQGGVADIKNKVLIEIKAALGDRVRLGYEMHDSLKLQVRVTEKFDQDLETIKAIAQQPWDVNGVEVQFPAEFKVRR